jgi:glycosyltransferase involved in cell wall biosynthesis
MPHPDLSAVVLCYQAGEDIHAVVEPLYGQLAESELTTELVLVANYWPDRADPTPDIVRALAAGRDDVVVVSEPKEGGMGWDMRSGLGAASGDLIVVIDGDRQNPTEDVVKMARLMRESGIPVMKGLRIARYDGAYRRLISIIFNFVFRALFGTTGLWDINGKPKGLTRAAYEAMRLKSDDWFIDAEIVLEAQRLGLQVGEMPVVFRRNDARESFVRLDALFEFARNMLTRRVRAR